MELPKFVLGETIRTTDSLIVGRRFYTLEMGGNGDSFLFWRGRKLGVEPSENISDLEKDYYRIFKSQIVDHINHLVIEEDRKISEKLAKSEKSVFDLMKAGSYHEYFLKELIPAYKEGFSKEVSEWVGDFLKEESTEENQENQSCEISVNSEEQTEEDFYLEKLLEQESIMDEIVIKNASLLFLDGECYKLKESKTNNKGVYVKIADKLYIPGSKIANAIEDFENQFFRNLNQRIKNLVFNEDQGILQKIYRLIRHEELLKIYRDEYFDEEGNIGFKKINKEYYAVLKAPAFCFYERKNGKYYEFNECFVGIKVFKEGKNFLYGLPVVIDSYSHPGLHFQDQAMQDICLGVYRSRFIDLEKEIREHPEKITEHLKEILYTSVRLIREGYYSQDSAWNKIYKNPERYKEVSEERARNVGVTNL